MQKSQALIGIKEISVYMRRSERTVLRLIKEHNLPVVKERGQWIAYPEILAGWRKPRPRGKRS